MHNAQFVGGMKKWSMKWSNTFYRVVHPLRMFGVVAQNNGKKALVRGLIFLFFFFGGKGDDGKM
jgi:hypothetical protein